METDNNVMLWSGARDYADISNITKIVAEHHGRFHLIGDCTGVDTLVRNELLKTPSTLLYCEDQESFNKLEIDKCTGVVIIVFVAQWKTLGKRAGPVRNGLMVKCAELLIQRYRSNSQLVAIHPCLSQSKGTRNMISQACKKLIPVRLYTI